MFKVVRKETIDTLQDEIKTLKFALGIANEENYKLFMLRQKQIKRQGKYQDKAGNWRNPDGTFTSAPRAL